MTLAIGSTLAGRYAIEAELGVGGMGTVYRARDVRLGRDVAVKVMSGRVLQQADAISRFEREARVGAQVNHPHIIQTFDFGQADGVWFLVLQLLTEGDLLRLEEQQRPVSYQTACLAGYQIADALVAAHDAGVVHRDLKPENVLVETTTPLHVRVADFGMAYLTDAADPKDGRLTRDGHFAGTPAYMAPEQVTQHVVGPAADIYALGCMLFELLTGRPPFEGSAATLLAKQVYAPAPRLSELRTDAPSGLVELVDRMLAKAAAMRPTAEAVRRRLAGLLDENLQPHERRRDAAYASDRGARMISLQADDTAALPAPSLGEGAIPIGLVGSLGADVITALSLAGFEITPTDPVLWLSIEQSSADVAALVATGVPVVASCPRDNFARVSQLLRLGVIEVVLDPLVPSTIVRKLRRALELRSRSTP